MLQEKRKRKGIMLCYPYEERRLTETKFGWQWPVIVQPKLNGERCRSLPTQTPLLLSSTELLIESVPHITEELKGLKIPYELDGELYVHGMPFEEIHSIVSRGPQNLHSNYSSMEYHLFDLPSQDAQINRWTVLNQLKLSPHIKLVPTWIIKSLKELYSLYTEILAKEYEGIIVRSLRHPYERKKNRFIMKFKPKKKDYYKILEVREAISKEGIPKGLVGAFYCCGDDGEPFKVGAGELTHEKRQEYWEIRHSLIDQYCEVRYQTLSTKRKVPLFAFCSDILKDNPEGNFQYKGIL